MPSITIQGQYPGSNVGTVYIGTYTIPLNGAGNFDVFDTALASGANTISIPSWAVVCLIVPPVANAIAITLKGSSGDTGLPLDPAMPTLWNLASSPPANFVLNAASAISAITTIVFA